MDDFSQITWRVESVLADKRIPLSLLLGLCRKRFSQPNRRRGRECSRASLEGEFNCLLQIRTIEAEVL